MHDSPRVLSNVVLFQCIDKQIFVMLCSQQSPAGRPHRWSLPSAHVPQHQTSLMSLEHTLSHTVGLRRGDVSYREQLYTSEAVNDGRASVCISYMYLSRGARWYKGSQHTGVFALDKLPPLTPSERNTIAYALSRLRAKSLYSSVVQYLIPVSFNLTELQQVFETVSGQKVDRRNFRKKILQQNVIYPIGTPSKPRQTEPHMYSFKKQEGLSIYPRPFHK